MAGGQESFAKQMNFLGLRPGGWAFYFRHQFRFFHCATPRGPINDTTVWGNYSLLGLNSIFHCATPRGLIRWVTVGGNGALLGLNSMFHCTSTRGLIRWVTFCGNGSLLAANSTRYCAGLDDATPSCLIPIETSGHDVRNGSPQFLYFLYFQAVFLYFVKSVFPFGTRATDRPK